jgi:tRNA dimethylallyltransferase
MKSHESPQPLVAVVGPTASGKSALGVWLAERLDGEVVACDSTQLYRGFDIGTAKPTQEERRGVPHHLIDVLEPHQESTAGGYRERALEVLEDLRQRDKVPVFTVGTGLYLRALLEGLADLPQRSEELRERLRASASEHPAGYLHCILQKMDREAAGKIAPADEQKLIRAIEICLLAKRPLSAVHRSGRAPLTGWRALKVGLMPSREALLERIQSRTQTMLARGWMEEVRSLSARCPADEAKPFDFIGYRELRAVARGEMNLEIAKEALQIATRRYAKRQMTWFRRESSVFWLEGFGDQEKVQIAALAWLVSQGLSPARGGESTSV